MKKRLLSSMCVIFLFTLIIGNASAMSKTKGQLTKALGMNAKQLYASEESRALFTICLAADTLSTMKNVESDAFTSLVLNKTYVGLSSNQRQLCVTGYFGTTKTSILIMIYTPSTNEIQYETIGLNGTGMTESFIDTMMVSSLKGMNKNGKYVENDIDAIWKAISYLAEM